MSEHNYLERILLRPEVERLVRMPTATLYARIAQGRFPRPIQLGSVRRVGWLESEVVAWMHSQPRSGVAA